MSSFFLGASIYLLDAYVSEIPDSLAQHYTGDAQRPVKLFGAVAKVNPAAEGERIGFTLDAEAIEWNGAYAPTEGRTQVNWHEPDLSLQPGDSVEVTGTLRDLKGYKNPGTFDYERYMHRRGIFTRMSVQGPGSVTVRGSGALSWLASLQQAIRSRGLEVLSRSTRTKDARAFVSALVLGERTSLSDEMEDWFKRTGTFHIIAISGMNVGLVYLIVSLALTPLLPRTRLRVAVSILVVWLYAFITGGDVPVVRASLMLTLVLTGYYLSREGDFLTAIAFATLVVVGLDPVVIEDIGFQLSFFAVVLLATFEPFFEWWNSFVQQKVKRIPRPIARELSLTLFASFLVGVGMSPLVAYHFNLVSLVFPIANMIVIPLASLVLAAGFACLIVGFIWLKAAVVFGLVAEAFSWMIFATVKLCSMVPMNSVHACSPPLWVLGLEMAAIVLVWWRISRGRKLAVFAALSVLMLTTAFVDNRLERPILRATFLDIGDADSCFLEFPNGDTMLVDAGFSTRGFDCGEMVIAPFLWKKGLKRVDTLLLTHPDNDHTGGAPFLMNNLKIGRLVLADISQTMAEFSDILVLADERRVSVHTVRAGAVLQDEKDIRVEVLGPPPEAANGRFRSNDTSIVLRIVYGQTSMLLTGDAERKALRFLCGLGPDLGSHVLKAPHHGLVSSFSKKFVEFVQPEFVVISGRTQRERWNMRERLSRYASMCDVAVSTQYEGAVILESDGHSFRLKTARREPSPLL